MTYQAFGKHQAPMGCQGRGREDGVHGSVSRFWDTGLPRQGGITYDQCPESDGRHACTTIHTPAPRDTMHTGAAGLAGNACLGCSSSCPEPAWPRPYHNWGYLGAPGGLPSHAPIPKAPRAGNQHRGRAKTTQIPSPSDTTYDGCPSADGEGLAPCTGPVPRAS